MGDESYWNGYYSHVLNNHSVDYLVSMLLKCVLTVIALTNNSLHAYKIYMCSIIMYMHMYFFIKFQTHLKLKYKAL